MPEASGQRAALLAGLAGLACIALAGIGGWIAVIGVWLAQPAFALAVRPTPSRDAWRHDLAGLLGVWAAGLLGAAVLMAASLSRGSRESIGLGDVLLASAMAGVGLIVLWRVWPLWHALERDGGGFAERWRALSARQAGSWRGLGAAALVAFILASAVILGWPGLLDGMPRWIAMALVALSWPAAHWGLQRIAPADVLPTLHDFLHAPEPIVEPAIGGDPVAMLYAAARAGRVDQALALLEAGADPRALPPGGDRDQRSLPVLAAVLPDLRLLRALIAAGVDVNAAHAGMTPLLAATRDSWHGRPEAVMTLLANGADPRAGDADGNTPLHHAARSSDPGVAALLRDAAAELDVLNADGITPLGMACASGNWRLARFLLERRDASLARRRRQRRGRRRRCAVAAQAQGAGQRARRAGSQCIA